MRTGSYSPKLVEYSVYYKTFYSVLSIRTVAAEYLVAMKLRSGRKYKNDLSDVIGILAEHQKRGKPITLDKINTAVCGLYGGWDDFPKDTKPFIENALKMAALFFGWLFDKIGLRALVSLKRDLVLHGSSEAGFWAFCTTSALCTLSSYPLPHSSWQSHSTCCASSNIKKRKIYLCK